MKRVKRYYYPYCGWREGFCLSNNGCPKKADTVYLIDAFSCKHFRERHPITKLRPQMLWGEESDREADIS